MSLPGMHPIGESGSWSTPCYVSTFLGHAYCAPSHYLRLDDYLRIYRRTRSQIVLYSNVCKLSIFLFEVSISYIVHEMY